MGLFVQDSDFETGDILIATSTATQINLNTCIDVIELDVLRKLFGTELYDLFIADLDVNDQPQSDRFKAVFNEFYEDPSESIGWCGLSSESEGIKKMLMRFIFVKFVNEQPVQSTSTGHIKSERNNAKGASGKEFGIISKYNIGVTSYQAIARKMMLDDALYPEYEGIAKGKTTMI